MAAQAWRARELSASADYYGAPHPDAEPTAPDTSGVSGASGASGTPGASGAFEDARADASDSGTSYGSEHAAPATQGRAARRRQLARWKKQRRRAVVASTVALVGGGLTLAVLPSRPSTGHDAQASATPEPKATATIGTDGTETDSSSVRPRTHDPRDSGKGADSSTITSPPRKATTVVSMTATKTTRETATAPRPTVTTSTQPPRTTTPVTADRAPATDPPAAQTATPPPPAPSTPPPADDSAADTPPPSPPPATTPPDRLCLLVLCIG
ncbi:hypothetical protein ACFRMN_10440 [Streptomyces sp. NPDC056835]|uniref:SCO2400 family protein n=1 Tax=Streptomyces sp. NPDC056835 TaxID=3345956 RepID=UPI003679D605